MTEPIYLVIERSAAGGEVACIYRDRLFDRVSRKIPKGSAEKPVAIYTLRIDRLPPAEQEFWLSKGCSELLDVYHWLRDEGTLPASNLADGPKEKPRQGRQLGDWWSQPKNPWPDRQPDPLPNPDSIGRRQ